MSKKSFLKFLFFLFLVFSLLSFGQFVLACEEGETRDVSPCGTQTCNDCHDEEFPNRTICDWGNCSPGGETQDCGTCGVKRCQSEGTSCSWDDCDETPEPDDEDTESWNEYRCQGTGCGGNQRIEHQKASQDYTQNVTCSGGGNWSESGFTKDGDVHYGTTSIFERCDLDWQLCSGSNEWNKSTRSCDCSGTCLEIPQNPRYYNNPNYPTPPPESYEAEKYEPEESEDSNNIFLPVKLDWDNTKAWKNGWQEEDEVLKECSEDCFQSYLIEINNTTIGNFSKALTKDSEYNPSEDQQACFLKSDTTHNLKVSACCSANGTNCGPKSNWSFTTNSAPEPILPADPDWADNETIENILLPVNLKWCQVETIDNKEILSYSLTPYLIENENIICHPTRQGEKECLPISIINPTLRDSQVEYVNEDMSLFTNLTSYAWQIAACKGGLGGQCGESSQIWKFETGEIILNDIVLLSPANKEVVGFPVNLQWMAPAGTNSFQYELYKDSLIVAPIPPNPLSESSILLESLELNTEYGWRVIPCKDFKGEDCQNWSDEWKFTTTGASPELTSPENNSLNISIPIKLEWGKMSGAKSYRYLVYFVDEQLKEQLIADDFTSENFVLIKYNPDSEQPKQKTDYFWKIATCADEEGEICGSFTDTWKLTTFELSPPSNLLPGDDETIFTYQMPKSFSWDSSAKYFKITISYTKKSTYESGSCPTDTKSEIIQNTSYFVSLACLGEYKWQVQACLDENCNERGELNTQNFTLDQTTPPTQFGLVPCGRSSDNPDTLLWNERDPCQFKHLFILLKNIIDFLLWRVTLIVLLLLVIGTAMIFYFSIGAPVMIIDIKGVWRAAGKGYAIIFLSWILINLFLNFLGYQVGIFGNWWQINF